jgi:hypothetical protein
MMKYIAQSVGKEWRKQMETKEIKEAAARLGLRLSSTQVATIQRVAVIDNNWPTEWKQIELEETILAEVSR